MYQIGWVPREREGLQINCAAVSNFLSFMFGYGCVD